MRRYLSIDASRVYTSCYDWRLKASQLLPCALRINIPAPTASRRSPTPGYPQHDTVVERSTFGHAGNTLSPGALPNFLGNYGALQAVTGSVEAASLRPPCPRITPTIGGNLRSLACCRGDRLIPGWSYFAHGLHLSRSAYRCSVVWLLVVNRCRVCESALCAFKSKSFASLRVAEREDSGSCVSFALCPPGRSGM